MAKYGYARVSLLSQSTDIQIVALTNACRTIVRADKVSGSSTKGRTELATILEFMSEGDILCVQ